MSIFTIRNVYCILASLALTIPVSAQNIVTTPSLTYGYGEVIVDAQNSVYAVDGKGLSKYDSDNNPIWYTTVEKAFNVEVDTAGNVYVGGGSLVVQFNAQGTEVNRWDTGMNVRDIEWGASGHLWVAGYAETTCKLNTPVDMVVAKYVASSGQPLWRNIIQSIRNNCTYHEAYNKHPSLAVNASGDVYVAGYFRNAVDFDPGAGEAIFTSNGFEDIFLVRYDKDGKYLHGFGMGSTGEDVNQDMVLDSEGNIYLTGYFSESMDFDPGPGVMTLTSPAFFNAYIAKYTPVGALVSVINIGGQVHHTNASGWGLAVDDNHNVYLAGLFFHMPSPNDPVDFDPGPGVATTTYIREEDGFLAKYNAAGAFEWVVGVGGERVDIGISVALSHDNNLFFYGRAMGPIFFNTPQTTFEFTPTSNNYGNYTFVSKFDVSGTLPRLITATEPAGEHPEVSSLSSAYPNPFTQRAHFNLTLPHAESVQIALYDVLGRQVALLHDGYLREGSEHRFEIDGSGLSNGLYLIHVEGERTRMTQNIVVMK